MKGGETFSKRVLRESEHPHGLVERKTVHAEHMTGHDDEDRDESEGEEQRDAIREQEHYRHEYSRT